MIRRWHQRWLRKNLPLIAQFQRSVAEEEIRRAGRILDWIGVAGGMPHFERVKLLAVELATRQGYTFDQAVALADERAAKATPEGGAGGET